MSYGRFSVAYGLGDPSGFRRVINQRVVSLLVVALFLLLRPLAAASPPDPTWIAGIYDDDDFDDVVIYIGLLASIADGHGPVLSAPDTCVRELLLPAEQAVVCGRPATVHGRAPP